MVAGVVWLLMVGIGFGFFARHEFRAGDDPKAPAQWPDSSQLALAKDRPTLLVFAHPQCPCSVATMEELARVIAHNSQPVHLSVVLFEPSERDSSWQKSAAVRRARSIPGANLAWDREGLEAARFHAHTSGHTLLYSANGRLLFDGGITGSRGHVGENAGQTALLSLLNGSQPTVQATPVFGCPILESCPRPK